MQSIKTIRRSWRFRNFQFNLIFIFCFYFLLKTNRELYYYEHKTLPKAFKASHKEVFAYLACLKTASINCLINFDFISSNFCISVLGLRQLTKQIRLTKVVLWHGVLNKICICFGEGKKRRVFMFFYG